MIMPKEWHKEKAVKDFSFTAFLFHDHTSLFILRLYTAFGDRSFISYCSCFSAP